jgi:hypothetical protein
MLSGLFWIFTRSRLCSISNDALPEATQVDPLRLSKEAKTTAVPDSPWVCEERRSVPDSQRAVACEWFAQPISVAPKNAAPSASGSNRRRSFIPR